MIRWFDMSEHLEPDRVSADEQRLRALLRAVEAPAPGPLRARIADLNAELPARRRRRQPALAFGGAFATAAAAAVALVLLLGGGGAPTAVRAAQLALAKPSAAAPARLTATGTEIAFPDWSTTGWPSTGVRHDSLGGRAVTTEFYRSAGATIGYAIVSGAPLRWGSSGQQVTRSHAEYQLLRSGGANVVAWVQDGHTCVLASRSASSTTLLALAVEQDSAATVSDHTGWAGRQSPAARA